MTLTTKEPVESTNPGKADLPSQKPENRPDQSPRSNPVCLEVPVTLRSLPGENGIAPGSTGPVREEGRTVIVFDNGAVLRVANKLPDGQKLMLSNLQGREVHCQIVNARNLPAMKGYIEVEFMEPVNDYWRIHQSPEPVSVSPPAVPDLASPQPAADAPAVTPSAAPEVPRAATPEKKTTTSSGSAPTFEDIAGLVRMSPAVGVRAKTNQPAAQMGAVKSKNQLARGQVESAKSASTISGSRPISNAAPGQTPIPATPEFSSLPIQKPAPANDFMARGMLASGQLATVSSSGESRRRIPLVIGGAALVLAGFGAGYLWMNRESAPAPATSAAVAAEASRPLPAATNSTSEPVEMARTAVEPEPAPPQPVSAIATASPGTVGAGASESQRLRQPADNTDAKQAQPASKKRPLIPNLRMNSPAAPTQNSAKLSDTSAPPSITEVASSAAAGGAPAVAMLSPVVRSESQPAPPASLGSPAPPGGVIREPKLISSTSPAYPPLARQSNTEGVVVVSAEVDAKGNVTFVKIIRGPLVLRQSAIDAVRQWKYSPALVDGKPATAQITVNVQFRLN